MQRRWSQVFSRKNLQPIAIPILALSGDVGVELSKSGDSDNLPTRWEYDELPDSLESSTVTQVFEHFSKAVLKIIKQKRHLRRCSGY